MLESIGNDYTNDYEEDFEEEIEESYRFHESSKKGRTEESVKESLMSMKESI
jgi:hypothetical protein